MGSARITDLLGYPYTRGMVDKRSCSLRTLGSSQLETSYSYALCNPAICLTLAVLTRQNVMLTAAGFALTIAFAAAALATHRGSLVACEGPAR
jgi:hypothetical protein